MICKTWTESRFCKTWTESIICKTDSVHVLQIMDSVHVLQNLDSVHVFPVQSSPVRPMFYNMPSWPLKCQAVCVISYIGLEY